MTKREGRSVGVGCGLFVGCWMLVIGAGSARAQELDPAIYVLVDTSGSMLMTPDGTQNTYGDGSSEHPHVTGTTSRLYMAKEALATVINAYGEVRWGLARFQQNSGQNYFCMCHDEIPNNVSGCGGYGGLWHSQDDCRLCDMMSPYPDYDLPGTHDRVCINYAGGIYAGCTDPITSAPLIGADILVPLAAGTQTAILSWIDHAESDPGEAGYLTGQPPENQPDPELRAVGGTPIGGSLDDLYAQLSSTAIGSDPLRGCRPYSIIVLTDGAESCSSDPVSAASQLRQTPDLLHTCAGGCPPGSVCQGTRCVYDVKTYVIAFAVAPNEFQDCNDIAVAGGTDGAIPATNDAELVAAMAQIIAASIRTELCNGQDDDCDGAIDEDFPEVGQGCDNGLLGQCYCAGVQQCSAGGLGTECVFNAANPANPCGQAAYGYGLEVDFGCDGLDNDCDGLVDEGLNCSTPPPEMCNGVDDDSDPSTPDGADDPAVGQPCGNSLGICEPGLTACVGGAIVCQGGTPPGTEVCNGLDDNCDGVVDGLTRTCYSFATGCVWNSGTLSWDCEGQCTAGIQVCAALPAPDPTNTWGPCQGETGPSPDICDGVDNDCDGQVDENLSEECYPPGSGPGTGCQESGGVWTCEGLCQTGTRDCVGGGWAQCAGHTTPTVEVCDLQDNDCNGQVDDNIPGLGQPCSNALGRCTPGILECQNGVEVCVGGDGPFEGECNGLDDDCDGEIDEPDEVADEEGLPCGNTEGECEPGLTLCVGGAIVCSGGVLPTDEVCDGLDNDCDTLIDNEAECPPDFYCVAAECRYVCDPTQEFPCPGGLVCTEIDVDGVDRWLCLPPQGVCGNTTCPVGWVCIDDACVDPCAGVGCEAWEECNTGFCVDVSCTGLGGSCAAGEVCNGLTHECETDPCAACASDEACVAGQCLADPCLDLECDPVWQYCVRDCNGSSCTASCAAVCACEDGEVCDAQGGCVDDPCGGACVGGEVCVSGGCVDDPCLDVVCAPYERCVGGACHADPCALVSCPDHTLCVAHDDGQGGAVGLCEPAPGHWVPHGDGQELTGTGGGPSCSTSGGGTGLLLGLLAFGWLAIRRRRRHRLTLTHRPGWLWGVVVLLALPGSGCELSTFETGGGGHWEFLDGGTDGMVGSDATTDASPDACVPTEEVCDGLDNDCDGVADNGFDFTQDPNNCGSCGNVCQFAFALGDCINSTCMMTCLPGYHDLNADDSDGCEYACTVTAGGVEICDGLDNDCNGVVDEGFDTQNDANNCGSCGFVCVFFQGTGSCTGGQCALSSCNAGYVDKDGNPNNGCECLISNAVDLCDGVDSDCDGQLDEDAPAGDPCYTSPSGCTPDGGGGFNCVGECHAGAFGCVGGIEQCTAEQGPVGEICNGLDDDCNGTVDDGFNLQTDLANCGSCGHSCFATAPTHAYTTGCVAGTCQFACLPGYVDLNGDLGNPGSNGCEYACDQTAPAGTEYCDGVDNDCDGTVDEAGDLVAPPANLCREQAGTPCSGVATSCTTGVLGTTWYCQYPAGVEVDPTNPNQVLTNELVCDGLDGNCDGNVDESFTPMVGTPCDDGLFGACRSTGTNQCNAQQDDVECVITNPGQAVANEVCDGYDNDCDGLVDESAANPGTNPSYVVDDVVTTVVGGQTVRVYRYEASRPSATAGDEGSGTEVRACSRAGVKPWSKLTYEQARLACQRAGMTLCGDQEWTEACDGQSGSWAYPYHVTTYNPTTCNGVDAAVGSAENAGSRVACRSSGYNVYDLSGNLREWTSDVVAYTAAGKAIYAVRGGAYTDLSDGLRCDFRSSALVEDTFSANVGFRCCSRCGNGVLDPGEGCDDGNLANGDGCSAICGAETCGDGVVQAGEDCDCGRNAGSLPAGCLAVNGAPASNCSVNCQTPEERCSSLYPGDQDDDGSGSDCADADCAGTWCSDVTDNDGDGFSELDGDCDDTNPNISPAADEVCDNGVDDNCNGFIDHNEPDKDGDGEPRCLIGNPTPNDCDDWDPARSPALLEICGDGIDNDCDGLTDVACATPCQIAAFERSYIGCEYWPTPTANSQLDVAFNNNFGVAVFNDNSSSAMVTVYDGGTMTVVASQNIGANSAYTFVLPFDTTLKMTFGLEQTERVANGAYRLSSTLPVTAYQFNPLDYQIGATYSYTNDAALLLPSHVLDTHYIVMARQTWAVRRDCPAPYNAYDFNWMYDPGFVSIVGTANNTQVTVTYSAYTHGGDEAQSSPGQVRNYTLNRGEVLQVLSRKPANGTACSGTQATASCASGICQCWYCDMGATYDLTGTIVESTAPVAVFSGSNCAFVPFNYWACDHLEEQMFPTATWGREFVVARTEPQNMSGFPAEPNVIRVLSGADNNTITFTPAQPTVGGSVNLDQGQWVEFASTQNFQVSGGDALMVSQFLVSQDYYSDDPDNWWGDPAYALAIPTEQYRTSYSFLVPSTMTYSWLNIVKPVAQPGLNAPTVYLDGIAIPETSFSQAIGNTYYGVARLDISSAPYNHVIESDQPFGIMVYGFARYTSYFYPGGLDLNLINVVN